MSVVAVTLQACAHDYEEADEKMKAYQDLLHLLGHGTPIKAWLAASLGRAICLQLGL